MAAVTAEPGPDHRATLADVAARVGLSKSSVSQILNGHTRYQFRPRTIERVEQAVRELNYRPHQTARSLRVGRTDTVAFIIDQAAAGPEPSLILRGAMQTGTDQQVALLCVEADLQSPAGVERAINDATERQVDAIICVAEAGQQLTMPSTEASRPIVVVNGTSSAGHPAVRADETNAGHQLVGLLVQAGHRRLGVLTGTASTTSSASTHRLAGITAALQQAHMQPAALTGTSPLDPASASASASGYHSTKEMLTMRPGVTAVICLQDGLSVGVYQALHELRLRVPDDISVVAFDEQCASHLCPGLTTAQLPYIEMGRRAMTIAATGARVGSRFEVPASLTIRESIAPPPTA